MGGTMSMEKVLLEKNEQEPQFKYDMYLAGPFEEHVDEKWKSRIKEEFPDLNIYDPEDHQDCDWFKEDLMAIYHSRRFVCYAANFPMSATSFETGFFYAKLFDSDLSGGALRMREVIIIWNEDVKPAYGRKWYERAGTVVDSTDEAIELLRGIYSS